MIDSFNTSYTIDFFIECSLQSLYRTQRDKTIFISSCRSNFKNHVQNHLDYQIFLDSLTWEILCIHIAMFWDTFSSYIDTYFLKYDEVLTHVVLSPKNHTSLNIRYQVHFQVTYTCFNDFTEPKDCVSVLWKIDLFVCN